MTAQLDHKIDQLLTMHQASPNVMAKYQWLSARWDCAKRGRDIEAGRAAPPTSPVER